MRPFAFRPAGGTRRIGPVFPRGLYLLAFLAAPSLAREPTEPSAPVEPVPAPAESVPVQEPAAVEAAPATESAPPAASASDVEPVVTAPVAPAAVSTPPVAAIPPLATPGADGLPETVRVERVEFGRAGQSVARSRKLRLSRDFTSVYYEEEVEGGERVVTNGVAGPLYDSIYSLEVAPTGARWSYTARRSDRLYEAVVDGVASPAFAQVEDLVWSADGRHWACLVRRGEDGAWALVRDGEVGEFAPGRIARLALSPDGSQLAWIREDDNGQARLAFLNGQRFLEEATGFAYTPFRWSTDGSALAGLAERSREGATEDFLTINGRERAAGSRLDSGDLVFSGDGRHFAVSVSLPDGTKTVVHDDTRHGPYRDLWAKPVLSPDGTRVAFTATLEDDLAHLVVDGVPGPAACNRYGVRRIRFSADGSTIAYVRDIAEGLSAVHVGDRVVFEGAVGAGLWLSPDGTRAAWVAKVDKGARLMLEGRAEEPVFREIAEDGAQFTSDGRDFLYVATRDRESFTLCLAGVGRRTYEIAAPFYQWDGPRRFTFVSYEAGVFYRETWTLPE